MSNLDDKNTMPQDTEQNAREPLSASSGSQQPEASAGEGRDEREDVLAGEQQIADILPVLPLRDAVVFNFMIMPLFISREKSVQAVEKALEKGRHLLVVAQKDEATDDPGPDDLYEYGTIVQVMRALKMPDSRVKILVQGVSRARIKAYCRTEPLLEARIESIPEIRPQKDATLEALMRSARSQSEKVLSLRGVTSPDVASVLESVDDPGRLADLIAANIRMKIADAQHLLETTDPAERLMQVNQQLEREVEVASVQARIQNSAREGMEKAQKDYFLREQLKAIRQELGEKEPDPDDDLAELKKALAKAKLPADVKKEADKQLHRLAGMHNDSSEANILQTYLDWLASLPWKKLSRDGLDIARAKEILDEDHCGLEKVKDRILEFLSVRKLNPDSKGPILCLVGPPGVGKTSLGRSIARAMNRKFQRLSLGGMHDEAEIRGHRRTYVGAMPGRIIQAIKQAGTRNPVMVLDEIDKIGTDYRGDPASAMLEVLDPEQNNTFSDHYLNVPFDLSKVMFICTANQMDTVPSALRDRMEVITLSGYTMQEKTDIAQKHLLPRQIEQNGLKEKDIALNKAAIETLIRNYTLEAGVRNLEREIGSVCRKVARRKAEGETGPFKVTPKEIGSMLGAPRYLDDDQDRILSPGMAHGLAWTAAGGVMLTVEVSVMKGKGAILLTGQLGDVMKESAQAAISYIRSKASELGVDPSFSSKNDIHIHVPAGSTPKDGPSAGVTLTTALISSLTGRKVRDDTCMTGEITLQGRVLPVGGIKEKILAGVSRGMAQVVIPAQNKKDLEEIPKDLLKRIRVHTARSYEDLLPLVFDGGSPKGKSKKSAEKKTAAKKNETAAAAEADTKA